MQRAGHVQFAETLRLPRPPYFPLNITGMCIAASCAGSIFHDRRWGGCMVRKFSVIGVGLAVAVFMMGAAAPARASLILETYQQLSGTGLGAVTTVLTVQNTPSETGCVSFGGTIGATMTAGVCTGS